ncbi:NAD(P)/FAD-dependent oxidoreductase [Cellvibrio sp. OA-2007]|uniref:NAD(P)/FAD-dependent oxidoreductase n=1 Tax=Cellvibrio sp. OA-2007 TaxID=529823 RepID=UPI0007848574|nr:FAD-dependent oxidoreductase [Cellvibrio sp. OA-2007]
MRLINEFDLVVVGAGIAGLTAATQASAQGQRVCVLEKSAGPGGRMATRNKPDGSWDHGAQYFTARTPEFRAQVQQWLDEGLVAPWREPLAVWDGEQLSVSRSRERYVGVPKMKSPLVNVAEKLIIFYNTQVTQVRVENGSWVIDTHASQWRAKKIIIALPAPQTQALLAHDCEAYALASAALMEPCWALMLEVARPLQLPFAAAFVNEGVLSWLAHNNSKPERTVGEHYVLHATAEWSRAHVEASTEWVQAAMVEEFKRLLTLWLPGEILPAIQPRHVHRWRFARATKHEPAIVAAWPEQGLALAGDWLAGGRVEGAYCSGRAAANALLLHNTNSAVECGLS